MKTRINITIDPEVVEELDRQAEAEGRSRSGMVERLVRHRRLVAKSSGIGTAEVDRIVPEKGEPPQFARPSAEELRRDHTEAATPAAPEPEPAPKSGPRYKAMDEGEWGS